jgi:hypothetical protein
MEIAKTDGRWIAIKKKVYIYVSLRVDFAERLEIPVVFVNEISQTMQWSYLPVVLRRIELESNVFIFLLVFSLQ